MRRRSVIAAGVMAAGLLAASAMQLAAHPIHTSVAELTAVPGGGITVKVRTFSDDFSAAVARATRTRVMANYMVEDAAAARYVAERVRVHRGGVAVALTLVAQRRDGDVTWLELKASGVPSLAGAQVVNHLLMEVFDDQVNIVKAQYGGRTFTTLFSRGDGAKRLP